MTDTLERLMKFLGEQSKAIVWEHNTHIGDTRAMSRSGIVNVGQLTKERWGESSAVLVGFGSYRGSVIAGREWGSRMMKMEVPEARQGSWEALLHSIPPVKKLIITRNMRDYLLLSKQFNHRAIGVVYDPEMEQYGNYVPSRITDRYDAFVYR